MFDKKLASSFQITDSYAPTLDQVGADTRIRYLQRVLLWTAGGLAVAAVSGLLSVKIIAATPALQNQMASLIIILGGMFFAQMVCGGMVRQPATRVFGFLLGNAVEGLTLGYLLLAAINVSSVQFGDPWLLISQALGLTVLVAVSLTAYVWTKPREFRWAQAVVGSLFLPMIALMITSFVFPTLFGGTLGLIFSAVFVAISALGLLLSIRDVLHHLREDQAIEGAFVISMGILVLFWNILSLLIRLAGSSRD